MALVPTCVDSAAATALAWDAEACGLWADPSAQRCSGARGRDGKVESQDHNPSCRVEGPWVSGRGGHLLG